LCNFESFRVHSISWNEAFLYVALSRWLNYSGLCLVGKEMHSMTLSFDTFTRSDGDCADSCSLVSGSCSHGFLSSTMAKATISLEGLLWSQSRGWSRQWKRGIAWHPLIKTLCSLALI
jgi:hypothetical protein